MKLKSLALLTIAGLSASGIAQAQVTNGNFTLGLSGWSVIGDVVTQSGAAILTTATLSDDDFPAANGAFNVSGNQPVATTGGLEAFSGLASGALDPDPGSLIFATEGSALKQTLTVAAGDLLSFDWRIFTNDSLADYAYVVIDGVKTNLALSAIATTPSSPFAYETAFASFAHTFPTAGTFDVSFGVTDVNDFSATTALVIDNVSITPVPEPSTAAFGLLALGAMLRRRRA